MTRGFGLFCILLCFQFVSLPSYSKVKKQHLLKYAQLMKLSKKHRIEYLKGLQKVMLAFGEEDKKHFSSLWHFLFINHSYAKDSAAFRCLGAGFPIRLKDQFISNPRGQACAVTEMEGFGSCPTGQSMCNPFVFGVKSSGAPYCMSGATTKKCFDNIVVGRDTFFPDELFSNPQVKESYNVFLDDFESLCNGDGVLSGGFRHLTNEACGLARTQMRANLRRINGNDRISLTNPLYSDDLLERTTNISGYQPDARSPKGNGELASSSQFDEYAPAGEGYSLHSRRYADAFIRACEDRGIRKQLCEDAVSPNTAAASVGHFRSLYGNSVPHILIPPINRWERGLDLLEIADRMEKESGVKVCELTNWYRPRAYNSLVSKARRSHHITAGALDLQFCSHNDRNTARSAFNRIRSDYPGLGRGTYVGGRTIQIHYGRDYHIRPQ